jgi:hypothetical protein
LSADENAYFWIGNKALDGYTTGNADIYSSGNNGSSVTGLALTSGSSYPVRLQWGHPITPTVANLYLYFNDGGQNIYDFSGYFFNGSQGKGFYIDAISGDAYFAGNIKANNLIYNTGDQTISGIKTFSLAPIISGNPFITGNLSLYATVANLTSTGSTLTNSINSLSGTLTSTYATISNLASTGSNLQTQINNLDNVYATDTSVTSVSNNLASTGSTLDSKINSLSGSSVLLYGNQSVGGIKTFRDNVYINNLFVTGTETIVSTNNFNVQSPYILLNLTGGAVDGGIFFVTGSGLTGVNDSGPIIGFDHVNKFKFGISTRNSDLSTLPDIASVQDIIAYSGVADNKFSTITNLASTGNTLEGKISSLSGTLTSTYATITNLASTGSTLQTNINNLSGYVNSSSSNIVFTTGNQTISGNKTFIGQTLITGKSDEFVGESITLVGGNGAGLGGDITLIGGIGSAITDGLVNVNASIAVNRGTNKNSFTDFYKSGDAGNSYLSISKDQIQIKNGATLLVSGVPVTPSLYATSTNLASTGNTLVTNLASTGSTLNSSINSLSGTLTGNYLTTSSASSTYATITNLASTGSTLNSNINSLSGLFTGYTGTLDNTYATDTQLANTGSTLQTNINNLSGYINSTSSNIVFTTGDQNINGLKTFASGINITGGTINLIGRHFIGITNPIGESINLQGGSGVGNGNFGSQPKGGDITLIGGTAISGGIPGNLAGNITLIGGSGNNNSFTANASEGYGRVNIYAGGRNGNTDPRAGHIVLQGNTYINPDPIRSREFIIYKSGDDGIGNAPSNLNVSQNSINVNNTLTISGSYDVYSQIENAKKLAIAYAIAL